MKHFLFFFLLFFVLLFVFFLFCCFFHCLSFVLLFYWFIPLFVFCSIVFYCFFFPSLFFDCFSFVFKYFALLQAELLNVSLAAKELNRNFICFQIRTHLTKMTATFLINKRSYTQQKRSPRILWLSL